MRKEILLEKSKAAKSALGEKELERKNAKKEKKMAKKEKKILPDRRE